MSRNRFRVPPLPPAFRRLRVPRHGTLSTWPGLRALLLAALLTAPASAQTDVTSPEQQFGHAIGADYVLPNYTQFMEYWETLAGESDRMVLDTIGATAEGRPQLMAIITSPENHTNLERYKQISRQLALAKDLTEEQAVALAAEGKAVVWIDGGLHATEVLGAQQLIETVYQLVSGTDAETMRVLDDVIVLAVHANPDGMELVSDWYMRNPDPEQRSTSRLPRLYQKYVGHDNNRDFYASTQAETRNMNRTMYREWYPQIVYNHHQTGPRGTVMFSPPFRDPFNYNFDPLILVSIDLVGAAMHNRFLMEGKPGFTMREGARYSTWWNGGLRTTAYFHNMIGLLTETIGNPTPIDIPFVVDRQLPNSDYPAPIEPQRWPFRNSVDYSVTANKAVLDIASKRRKDFLLGIYRMGRNAIDRGNRDSWTHTPRRVAAAEAALEDDGDRGDAGGDEPSREDFVGLLRDPAARDARGYIIPANQADFLTATKFVNALLDNGVEVLTATEAFELDGTTYPAGSYVVKTAQAFRPHILDMFEPQDHPDDIPYDGAPPTPPYDVAGWTLAFQMGVQFDRILEGFDGPFEPITSERAQPPAGRVIGDGAGYLLSHRVNDAFTAVNRLLAASEEVLWATESFTAEGATFPAGTFFIPASSSVRSVLDGLAAEKGLVFEPASARPDADLRELRTPRIGLWDRYGGSMPSGWTRWTFEQFEFPFEVVYPPELDEGDLDEKYDVLVFVDGAIRPPPDEEGDRGRGGFRRFRGGDPADVPAEFQHMLGGVTADTTIPRLRAFLEAGGTIITIGGSTSLAEHLGLPVHDALVETVDGREQRLPSSKYYVPGSVLEARVDNTMPIAHGMPERADFFFDRSPVFALDDDAAAQGVRPIAWFDTAAPLRSGWAWGQERLEGGVIAVEADVGRGKLFMFGPEIAFRAQPHGTFKLLFNGLYAGATGGE